ncbi:MAG: leucyl/phenylalanyl-tRNA--protein transferase [Gammaproteobacteria bacterium HGW-Gammaproteobacteria-3]|nr:MAG: leucyl/phenylalanyl-tRNA--protein transferase [Gammaproteobacteria bacterium HGW-Gammaproteobacteria-3]
MALTALDPYRPDQAFPPLTKALDEPNGLLAIGGCLSPVRLLNAYRRGIFPWYNPGEPILWWSPDPRLVMFPEQVKLSRSLQKTLRRSLFTITYDSAFNQVIECCAASRAGSNGTWITEEIKQAYRALHVLGLAHSAEAWAEGELVGGLYGIAIGQVFFGESMFHKKTDASKVAFVTLAEQLRNWHYQLIDCQVQTQHLLSLGAQEISRRDFVGRLHRYCLLKPAADAWQNR